MSKQKVKIPNTDVEFRVNATSVSFFRGGKKTDSLSRSYIKNMTLFYSYWKALDDNRVHLRFPEILFRSFRGTSNAL
jgi:hypothetical protein